MNDFLLYEPRRMYPRLDPLGTVLGSATVTIQSIGANRDTVALTGLPADYPLSGADPFAIDYGSPLRRYYGRFSEAVSANGSGVTALATIRPRLPVGISAGASVILKKPACRGIILPDSFDPGSSDQYTVRGMRFTFLQRA
jgi:hypothetical protein